MSRAEDVHTDSDMMNCTSIDRSQRSSNHRHQPPCLPRAQGTPQAAASLCIIACGSLSDLPFIHLVDWGRHWVFIPTAGSPFIHKPPPHRNTFLMSSSNPTALRQLRHRGRSSPDFRNKLSNALSGEEYGGSVPNLQGNDLVALVDHLDKVYRPISLLCFLLKQVQALNILDFVSWGFQKCLRELGNICRTRVILLTSYTLSSLLLKIGRHPVASEGPGDVYEGTLNGSRICVKCVRPHSKDGPEKATKVRCPIISPFCIADEIDRRSTRGPCCGNSSSTQIQTSSLLGITSTPNGCLVGI